ncbi:MerR family regulatory protein [Thermomonospora echinospora]|uniref:MerR family regulatory protein n=1 Tax=Thermomonospora echinospora TaxID=1992 RepID=A0A1H6AZG6_9ACTN|nr:MerR family transcriptional regulator [Thermomonospora echinospora]SEG53782.1 MerR family regulatory protein [Thermomonospora echinospora]
MRIGGLAALVGVSTRTVRHYHHLGLVPGQVRRILGFDVKGMVSLVLWVARTRIRGHRCLAVLPL